jgi:protocatechuate 3,4-dioxygenase beta subunit
VRVTPGGAGVRTASFVLSDDRGQFHLTAPRAATLTFSKNGFLPATVGVAAAAVTDTSLTVTLVRAGVVSGRVLDAEGQPVIGGGVRLWRSDSSPGMGGRSVMTAFSNDLGEFRIGGLAAGRYEISSYHDFDEQERLRVSDEAREQRVNLSPRVIGEAQALSGITTVDVVGGGETQVTLQQSTNRAAFPSGGTLSGSVIDEFGEPVERMRVRAWRVPSALGGTAQQTGAAATTDDRGQFRLFHLPPGQYVIEVSSPNQPASTSLAPVYYPGTNVIGLASLVPLETGQSMTNLTIPFLPSTLPSVHGVALDAAGRPLRGVVGLMPAGGANGVRGGTRTTQPAADGSFSFSNVASGEYVVRATGLGVDDPRVQLFMLPSEFGMQRIVVGDGNLGPLRLTTSPTARVTGRFEFEGGTPPPSLADFNIQPVSVDPERTPDRARPLVTPPPPTAAGTFEIQGLTGMTTLRLTGAPSGWWLKEIRGSTTLSPMQPFDPAVETRLVLVMSNESARVLGRVVQNADAPGIPTVVLFSTDERYWRNGSPFVRRVRANEQRTFAISTVPPGEYFLTAVADADLTLDDDELRTVLDALSQVALRITLSAGDEQRRELRPAVLQR